jgi:hypothetical protein
MALYSQCQEDLAVMQRMQRQEIDDMERRQNEDIERIVKQVLN